MKVGRKYSKIILNTHLDLEKFNAQNPDFEKVPNKKEHENKVMIIEFEKTRKTKQRMRIKFDVLRQHYCKNGYEVLFIVPNESMKKFVDDQIKISNEFININLFYKKINFL